MDIQEIKNKVRISLEWIPTENNTKLVALQNSGIMKAYSIENAVELIKANPVGCPIPKI